MTIKRALPPRVSVKDSIATKLLKAVFSIYLIVTVAVTVTHMVAEYSHTKENVRNELKNVQDSFEPGLARALWDLNTDQMESIYMGMVGIPTVIGVEIKDEDGTVVGSIGITPDQGKDGALGPISGNLFWHSESVYFIHNEKRINVGTVISYSSSRVVMERVKLGFIFIIVNAVIKTVALWGLFLWLSRKMLARPLAELTMAANRLEMENLGSSMVHLETGERDELKVLEEAFNGMVGKLRTSRESLRQEIKEREDAERMVRELNRELENRVAIRTDELEKSLDTVKRTQKQLVESEKMAALGGLVAGVAHEINTPVGIGITMSSYLGEKTVRMSEVYSGKSMSRRDFEEYLSTVSEGVKTILNNLIHAGELITSFKQVAVDQSSENRREFELKAYMEDVVAGLKLKIRGAGHRVIINCGEEIFVDSYPGSFSQIITNFIMNSLIHGFEGVEGGEIVINASLSGEILHLDYRDSGVGMGEENLKQIFDPFFTTKRARGGTGLGMHIVYNIVTQKLGGSIRCSSSPGRGVLFTLRIPLNRGPDGELSPFAH